MTRASVFRVVIPTKSASTDPFTGALHSSSSAPRTTKTPSAMFVPPAAWTSVWLMSPSGFDGNEMVQSSPGWMNRISRFGLASVTTATFSRESSRSVTSASAAASSAATIAAMLAGVMAPVEMSITRPSAFESRTV